MNSSGFERTVLLREGDEDYARHRIPSMVVLPTGRVVVIWEGRWDGGGDHDEIHLLARRSDDGGRTWSETVCVHREKDRPKVSIGNPCPVVDEDGTIHLLFTRDNRDVFATASPDGGEKWTPPRDITPDVKPDHWKVYWTGPGHGVRLRRGPRAGRLLAPSYHTETDGNDWWMRCHGVYSDDHGETWRIGESALPADDLPVSRCNWDVLWNGCECMAEETTDGGVYLTIRNQDNTVGERAESRSEDGGETWSPVRLAGLPDPTCQASIIRHGSLDDAGPVLLANLATRNDADKRWHGRRNLSISISRDECRTWTTLRSIHAGPSAYSDLAVLDDGTICCFYEAGEKGSCEEMHFARFTLDWLEHGADEA